MRVAVLYNALKGHQERNEGELIAEHEVFETMEAVTNSLETLGHEAVPLRCTTEGMPALQKCDAVFNLAEGFEGNLRAEPYIAGFLELIGKPYTGSPPGVLELCRNKYHAKLLLEREGIPTPRFQLFRSPEETLNLGFPVIVKPALEDASIGITSESVAWREEELRANVKRILENYLQPALVEEYIDGREINVGVLGNKDNAQVLPLSEIAFNFPKEMPKIMSFEAKWIEGSQAYVNTVPRCPTEIEPRLEERIKNLALQVYRKLEMRDYARIDFRVRGEDIFVIEANPNPCLNPEASGFVRSAGAAGLSYTQVVEKLLELALERRAYYEVQDKTEKTDSFAFNNLVFRQVKPMDAPILAKWFEDEETTKFMEPLSPGGEEQEVISILTSDDEDFIIHQEGRAVGFASIYNLKGCTGEISYLIGEKRNRGCGLGNKIAKALVEYGFTKMGLNSIFASSTVENSPSIKALKSAGFKKIGTRRAYQRIGKECLDEVLLDITLEDYLALRKGSLPSILKQPF